MSPLQCCLRPEGSFSVLCLVLRGLSRVSEGSASSAALKPDMILLLRSLRGSTTLLNIIVSGHISPVHKTLQCKEENYKQDPETVLPSLTRVHLEWTEVEWKIVPWTGLMNQNDNFFGTLPGLKRKETLQLISTVQ